MFQSAGEAVIGNGSMRKAIVGWMFYHPCCLTFPSKYFLLWSKGHACIGIFKYLFLRSVPDHTICTCQCADQSASSSQPLDLQDKLSSRGQEPVRCSWLTGVAATCVDQIRLLMIDRLHAHWHQDFIWVYFLHCILFYDFMLCWFSSGAPPCKRFPPLRS